MATVLRLARAGAKKRPHYAIVATDSRNARDGRYIEQVGTYNPMLPRDHEQRTSLNAERAKYWLTVGAQPTDRVARILTAAGLMAARPYASDPKKAAPKAKAQERTRIETERAEKESAAAAEAAAKPAPAPEPEVTAAPEAAAEETPAAEAPTEAAAETPEA